MNENKLYTFDVRDIYAFIEHPSSAANVPEHWRTVLKNRILFALGSPFRVNPYSVSVRISPLLVVS